MHLCWSGTSLFKNLDPPLLNGEDNGDIPVPEVTNSATDMSDEELDNGFVDYIVL